MAVRMLCGMADEKRSWGFGEIFEGDPDCEARLVAAGSAELIEDEPEPKQQKAKAKK